MTIPKRHLELVRSRTNPSDIIGKYVPLRRKGKKEDGEWIGPCPFLKERTPSFTVTDTLGIYQCFGCGNNGSAVTFLVEFLGISFEAAVVQIAEHYKIKIPKGKTKVSRKKLKDRVRRTKVMRREDVKEEKKQEENLFDYTHRWRKGRYGKLQK